MYKIFKQIGFLLYLPIAGFTQIGYLSVDCQENTTIYLDSVLIARQSFSNLALLPGSYIISADPVKDFSWQSRTPGRKIEIEAFERTFVNLNEISSVKIYSNPIGSDVFAGNQYLGKTPLIMPMTAFNGKECSIKRVGYKEEKFSLLQDQTVYTFNLSAIDPDRENRTRQALLGGTEVNWFKESLVLTSFVSSWAAFFFKRKADDLHGQYEGAAIPSRIDYFYNETEKYDRYSEVALGISAVSLGVYLFILMTE